MAIEMEGSLAREYRRLISQFFQSKDGIRSEDRGPAIESILQIENAHSDKSKSAHFAALETAFRESFYHIIVSIPTPYENNDESDYFSLLFRSMIHLSRGYGYY